MCSSYYSKLLPATLVTGLSMAAAFNSSAAVIITVQESGSDVIATATGSIDTGGLSDAGSSNEFGRIFPSLSLLAFGAPTSSAVHRFASTSGLIIQGSGAQTSATSGTGMIFSFAFGGIYLPTDYVSKTPFTSTATFVGKTLSSLGVNLGTTTVNWGSGANADSAVVTVGPVPEPESYAMVAGVLCLGIAAWRRRNRAA